MPAMPVKRVLVVEDDPDIGRVLRTVLQEAGYGTTLVSDGAQALAYLRSGARPDVILLDLMMAGMDGGEFRRHQLADPELSTIPVVVVTASANIDRCVSAIDLVTKPFTLERVLGAVDRFCVRAGTRRVEAAAFVPVA